MIRKIGMVWFVEPGLTEDLCVVQKEGISVTGYKCDTYTWQRSSIFIRGTLIFSSERMLHKDYYCKGSVAKKNLWSWCSKGLTPRQTDWRQTASRKVTLTLSSQLKISLWLSTGAEESPLLKYVTRKRLLRLRKLYVCCSYSDTWSV
jgi:hypothetical protein